VGAAARDCATNVILNNSNAAGPPPPGPSAGPSPRGTVTVHSADSRVATPQWCQMQCCASLACSGFTFIEHANQTFTCLMNTAETREIVPAGPDCAGTACWAAMGNTARPVTWSIEVNGEEMSLRRPIPVPAGSTVAISPAAPARIKQGEHCLSTAGSRVVVANCSSEFSSRWRIMADNVAASDGNKYSFDQLRLSTTGAATKTAMPQCVQLRGGKPAEGSPLMLSNCSVGDDDSQDFFLWEANTIRLKANADYCIARGGPNSSAVLQNCNAAACTNNCEWDFPKPTTGTLPAVDGYYGIESDDDVEVLLDGSVAQVFFNGDVVTLVNRSCSSSAASLTLSEGGDALVRLDAWRMVV
jgi:hypothetical protein